jgi:hypothetical protein
MYYLHELNDTKCYDGSLITAEHYDESRSDKAEYCSFFDYNPGPRVCCIPAKDEPSVPSFNRYTINRTSALLTWDRRRLAGGGGRTDWMLSVDDEPADSHNNVCAQPAEVHGLFEMGGYLEYLPVFAMMLVIIVFTIFCEQSLVKCRSWVDYFNPLLQPCVDKVRFEWR